MDINNAASVIKATVDMETVIGLYGYQAKHGKMVCPFHGDKNASLQIYRSNDRHNGWHCFGCGKGGSVIDFVMEHEGCDFVTAVKAIDHALGLRLLENTNLFDMQKRKEEQELFDQVKDAFDAFLDAQHDELERMFRENFDQLRAIEDMPVPERTPHEWDEISQIPETMKYIEHLQERNREIKRKVMAWRNQARRARSG